MEQDKDPQKSTAQQASVGLTAEQHAKIADAWRLTKEALKKTEPQGNLLECSIGPAGYRNLVYSRKR